MGIYKYIREAWKKPREAQGDLFKERLVAWRREPVTVVLDHPTRLDRARALGYKAKQGYIMVRQRVSRGGHTRPDFAGGRRPKRFTQRLNLKKNYQTIAEERAQGKFENLSVLNSYELVKDGKHAWFEVIMVDPNHPVIKADPRINWICAAKNQNRVYHGKTSAGRKGRGMRG